MPNQQIMNCSLIIVDTNSHNFGVVTDVVKAQNIIFKQTNSYRPILSLVDVSNSNKYKLFDLGVFDYISCPLIVAELRVRVLCAIKEFEVKKELVKLPLVNPGLVKLAENTAEYLKSRLHQGIKLVN